MSVFYKILCGNTSKGKFIQNDNNGNMTSSPGKTITYNYDNMPTSINGTTFVYDFSGQRVKKNSTIYIGKLYECTGGSCTKYIFAGSSRIAYKIGSATYYYHTDHLGSSSIITNASGNKVNELYYYPYGKTRYALDSSLTHKFTGQEEDEETGLYYYGARYYDPAIGRFISPDSIVPDFSDPQTLNRYSYCRNNPIILTDPSGNIFGIDDLLAIGIGAAIGAISSGVQSDWDVGAMGIGALVGGVSGGVFSGVEGAVAGAIQNSVSNATVAGAISGAAGGAAAGATAGGLGAAIYGGNVLRSMLIGAGTGAVIGGVMGAINGSLSGTDGIGGPQQCANCMSPDVAPQVELPKLDYHDFFEGNEIVKSDYGWRTYSGKPDFHSGIDVNPRPKIGYGTKLLAPSNGNVIKTVKGGMFFRPDGFPKNGSLFLYHLKPTATLLKGTLPMTVNKGDVLGTLANIGRLSGPHGHIQLHIGNKVFNPIFVFPY